jgi:hypothetical protein
MRITPLLTLKHIIMTVEPTADSLATIARKKKRKKAALKDHQLKSNSQRDL